jgi:phosphodiesterase/alkaline phosphatase D-like protein
MIDSTIGKEGDFMYPSATDNRGRLEFAFFRTRNLCIMACLIISVVMAGSVFAGDPTPTSITVKWTSPGDDGNSGLAAQYDLRYSPAVITNATWASATRVTGMAAPKAAGTPDSHTVTGLNSGTTYYFAIKAADEVPNWSGISNILQRATLPEQTPPAAITGMYANNVTVSSVRLLWSAPGDDSTTGTAAQYDVRYSTSPITIGNWGSATQATGEPAPRVAGTSESFTANGLNPSTTYYFAIRTADEVPNWSGLSNVVTGTTSSEQIAPASVTSLVAGAPTPSSMRLIWTAPGDDSNVGTATSYDVRYSTATITDANWSSATQASGEPAPLTTIADVTRSGMRAAHACA